jgi:colanic acid/amylovoran biosynthesis glycosyltransferase
MRLAYLAGRYPAVSHTFILREVRALRALGRDVTTFAIWRTAPEELLSGAEREEAASTYALLPPAAGDWAAAHLRAALTRPRRYLATLRRAVALAPSTPRGFALGILWWAEAVVLLDRCRRERIEHLHVHLNGTAPSVALLAGELSGGRLTYSMTVHGPSEFYDVHAEALAEKVRDAAAVVCISDFARSQLMGLVEGEHWDKLRVVHCGVDPSVFAAAGARNGRVAPHVLCVGRLVSVKGQGVLLEALAELRDRGVEMTATFVGDGPTRPSLEAAARKLGLDRQVEFAGSVSQEAIRDEYARADVFCLPSFAEGVPIVLMEAMAMEIPVVTTTVMGIGELVEDDVSGLLVRPGRADLLADALARLASDPALRRRLGEAGRRKVLAEFDLERSAAELDRMFAAVAQEAR